MRAPLNARAQLARKASNKQPMSAARPLSLYRSLLRESAKMPYNVREYSLRTVRGRFRENRNVQDATLAAELLAEGERNLALLRRQAVISQLYVHDTVVVEQQNNEKST